MGLFDKIMNREKVDREFIKLIRALDNDEEWAKRKVNEMWKNNDTTLIPKMDAARIQIYRNAALQGDSEAQYWMGMSYRGIDMKESLKWFIPLANNGNIKAIKGIAGGYTQYGGYGDNPEQYRYWYMKAAKLGDAEAQATIGLEFSCDKNYDEALKWYKLSSEQGYSKGSLGVAQCLESIRNALRYKEEFLSLEEIENREEEYDLLIEDYYIDAVNTAKSDEQFGIAASGLGHHYLHLIAAGKADDEVVKRAAYFLYESYLCGRDYELDWFNKVVAEHNLYVDVNDIEEWAQREMLFS